MHACLVLARHVPDERNDLVVHGRIYLLTLNNPFLIVIVVSRNNCHTIKLNGRCIHVARPTFAPLVWLDLDSIHTRQLVLDCIRGLLAILDELRLIIWAPIFQ